MNTTLPIGVPVIVNVQRSILIATIPGTPKNLMIAVHDLSEDGTWNIENPEGYIFDATINSWELLSQKDLPLLVSYRYKWPLFEELLKGTTPWPSPQSESP
jgi:hypothetical protein